MSDNEENENEPHVHGFVLGPSPEQVKAHMDHMQMAYVDIRHGIDDMVRSMKMDHLIALRVLLQQVSDHQNLKLATFYEGRISGMLESKYGICGACGVNHEEEMHKAMDEASKQEDPPKLKVKPSAVTSDGVDLINEILTADGISPDLLSRVAAFQPSPPMTQLERDMMAFYGLDDLWEGDNEQNAVFLGYTCKNCGMRYQSIQDRMLKPVDNCSGCFRKAAHG